MIIDLYDNNNVQIGTLYTITDIGRDGTSDIIAFKSNGRTIFKLSNGFYKKR